MDKIHRGSSVTTFQVSCGDVPSLAFAVSLKIKQQHRITGMKKKSDESHHLQPVGANSMHQNDHTFA